MKSGILAAVVLLAASVAWGQVTDCPEEPDGQHGCAIQCPGNGPSLCVVCPAKRSDFDACGIAAGVPRTLSAASQSSAEQAVTDSAEGGTTSQTAADGGADRRCTSVNPAGAHDQAVLVEHTDRCIEITEETGPVTVTLVPGSQDHDLCVWELDGDWADSDRYAQCHGYRNSPPADLHCRSSNGGTQTDQVEIDDSGGNLMACVAGYQGAAGGYKLYIESGE